MATRPYPTPAEMAAALAHKLAEAEHIDYVTPCPIDWSPRPSHCHDNAEEWVRLHPTWSVVCGWLHVSGNVESGAIFDAHSVVRDASGRLWDVTQQTFHSFIRYDGPEAQFLAAVSDRSWVQITYLPATT
ncbi:hypothetical protein [Cupriavidus basilensis]|uniref:hypothetical protein n=1 Tax=Cupriavidus basilensis TaxID=68895 RepID=UPI0012E000A7|nr:hypothetical protein [Cupriavidus basilensis]